MHTSEKEGMGWSNVLPQFEIALAEHVWLCWGFERLQLL